MACRVFAVLNSFWRIDNPPKNFFPFWPIFPVKMWLKFPAGATSFKVGRELGVWCLVTSLQERTKVVKLSCRSVIQLLRVIVFTQRKINLYVLSKKKSSLIQWIIKVLLSWSDVTACLAQDSFRFYQSANLKGRGSSGKFETRFHREIGSEQEKKFGESYVCVRN